VPPPPSSINCELINRLALKDEERWYVLRKLHQATKEMSRSVSRERQPELGAQRTREGLTLTPGPSDDDPPDPPMAA
jgi:hypothetical protein